VCSAYCGSLAVAIGPEVHIAHKLALGDRILICSAFPLLTSPAQGIMQRLTYYQSQLSLSPSLTSVFALEDCISSRVECESLWRTSIMASCTYTFTVHVPYLTRSLYQLLGSSHSHPAVANRSFPVFRTPNVSDLLLFIYCL
jgi:hypothetical protein